MLDAKKRYPSKCCLIYDNGLFCELAPLLAKDFGRVYYVTPRSDPAFARSNAELIGHGLEGVTRINDIWRVEKEVDLWVFPDTYDGDLQVHLRDLGHRVFGSFMGEDLELDRDHAKKFLKSLGMDIGPYKVVKGMGNLRSYLKVHDDQWIKTSRTRGDFESFHSPNYKIIEPRLDALEHDIGAKKKFYEFIVEDAINDACEICFDAYTIDGQYPTQGLCGLEIKDKGYIGIFQKYEQMPNQIRETNALIAPILKNYGYKNFFGLEMRITKNGRAYIIDPLARFGSPPSELAQLEYTNLAEIIWEGADGKIVDPTPKGKWGAELLIHSSFADKNWVAVHFPPEIRDHVKLRNCVVIDNTYFCAPQAVGLPEIGAVVDVGNTMEEAIKNVTEKAEQVEGYYIEVFPESLDEANQEIEKLEGFGIKL